MASKKASNLVKKLQVDEDVYATDVIFSAGGNKMFVNTADANYTTTLREYKAPSAHTSTGASELASYLSTSRDVSTYDTSNNFIFTSLQNQFNFVQGVSDMHRFVFDLSNTTTPAGNFTDQSLCILVDASVATASKHGSVFYRNGVSAFVDYLDTDTFDTSKNSVPGKVALANKIKGFYLPFASKVEEQFARVFLKDDGKKLYLLYKNKFKTQGGNLNAERSNAFAIRTLEFNPVEKVLQDISSQTTENGGDVLVYDVSLVFDPTAAGNASSRGNGNTGLYSQISDNSHRDIMGFHISKNGDKIFFLARRGKNNAEETETIGGTSGCRYFGEVSEFALPSAFDVSSTATHTRTIRFYGNRDATSVGFSPQDSLIMPIDINFSYNGKKLHILGSNNRKKQFIYTYALTNAFTLPSENLDFNNIESVVEIKDNLLISFSSVNDTDGTLKNVVGVGAGKAMAQTLKAACVEKGTTHVINSKELLTTTTLNSIAKGKLIHVIEHGKPKSTKSQDNYYDYDADTTTITTDTGNKLISALQRGDTITFNGITFTFLARLTKESAQGTLNALVFSPSCSFSVDITANDGTTRKINLQPLSGPVQTELQSQGITIPGPDNY